MYRIIMEDNSKFRAFLSIKDIGTVDIILTENTAKFILNSNEVFAKITTKCNRALGDIDLSFKINRSILESMFRDGAIEINECSESIILDFYSASGKFIYSVEVEKQTVFPSMYEFKERILSEGVNKQFDTDQLKDLNNLAASTGSTLSVCNGIASVITKTNARVYKQVAIDTNFAITPKAFSILRKCNLFCYTLHEYVCTVNKSFIVMVNTVRMNPAQDYEMLCGKESPYKSRYAATVDFSNLLSFFATRKIKADSVDIDMHSRMVKVDCNSVKYSIPIEFTDEKCATGYTLSNIKIPMFVLMQIIMYAGKQYRLLKKDEFIMIKSESGMVVLFS